MPKFCLIIATVVHSLPGCRMWWDSCWRKTAKQASMGAYIAGGVFVVPSRPRDLGSVVS